MGIWGPRERGDIVERVIYKSYALGMKKNGGYLTIQGEVLSILLV